MIDRLANIYRGFLADLVDGCCRHAAKVVSFGIALCGIAVWYAYGHLGMDTDTAKMISADAPWRQADLSFRRSFPSSHNLVIVIDAPSDEAAADAASALILRLGERKDLFRSLRRPDDMPFFRKNGILFLSVDEVSSLAERLVEMQPLIGKLNADPTLRGLFNTLILALDSIDLGRAEKEMMDKAFSAVADTVATVNKGQPKLLSWQSLLTARDEGGPGRRFILASLLRDYSQLQSGAKARRAVREAVKDLGLTKDQGYRVRQTGSAPLADEEFATVAEGAGLATIGSFILVCLLLFMALRSWRLIFAIQTTLTIGLLLTAGFAALTVGKLNMLSVTFAVLFIGMGVDFGIQYSVRYREERHKGASLDHALRQAASGIGISLTLATICLMAGFLSFLPTDYKGVSELGLISSGGMLIALVLNLTFLPALLKLLALPGEPAAVGYVWAAPIDRFLVMRRKTVLAVAVLLSLAGMAMVPLLRFDFNPLNLKDPRTESVSTIFELMNDPLTTPNALNALAPDAKSAIDMAERLKALPEVDKVVTLFNFIPKDQDEKLAMIGDMALTVAPSLMTPRVTAPADANEILTLMQECAAKLNKIAAGLPDDHSMSRLAAELSLAAKKGKDLLPALERALLNGLLGRIEALRSALEAGMATLDNLPPDLVQDWIGVDGRYKIMIYPKGDGRSNEVLRRFVDAVRKVAPNVTGTPVTIQESGRTVVDSFLTAGALAFVLIAALLRLVLGRWIDVLLVFAPLGLAVMLTIISSFLMNLPVNFANIITLPLLLGIGVAFGIYFVINWRRGETAPLQSSTARAVIFSALTTIAAFGSLALSSHPGTADLGILLFISVSLALACTLILLPSLLALADGLSAQMPDKTR